MQFGLHLPTWSWPDLDLARVTRLKDIARRAEELGFEWLWAPEHYIVAPGLYGSSFLATVPVIAYTSAVTERIKVGSGIVIAPLRNPVLFAKEIATLQALAQGRFVLGLGAGWDQHEFEVVGVPHRERGPRTDELIAVLRRLLTETDVSFHGKYYHFDHVTIEPTLERFPELWIGGGARVPTSLSPDRPQISEPVLRRVLHADGWLARASGNDELVRSDLAVVRQYLESQGRDPDSLHYGHINFLHIPRVKDKDGIWEEEREIVARVLGGHRSFEHLQSSHFMGPVDQTIERIAGLRDAGVQSVTILPLDYDLEQIERFAAEVMPHFA